MTIMGARILKGFGAAFLLGFVFVPTLPAQTRPDGPTALRPRRREINGTVRVNGCALQPEEIRLRAEPMRTSGAVVGRQPPVRETVGRITDGVPQYRLRGVRPGTAYRLSASVPPERCGKIFWRGPEGGLTFAGGPPVDVEGFAATTLAQVLKFNTERWVGTDDLHIADPADGARHFRWRSTVPGVYAGEVQVTTQAFPTKGAFGACDEPEEGVVYRRIVRLGAGEWTSFDLDLNAILAPPDARSDAIGNARYRNLLHGAPVYVRVVPLTRNGPACNTFGDGVPSWVLLASLSGAEPRVRETDPGRTPPPGPRPLVHQHTIYTPPSIFEAYHPTYNEYGWRVITPHRLPTYAECFAYGVNIADPLGCYFVIHQHPERGGTDINPPEVIIEPIDFDNASSGWEQLTSMAGGTALVLVDAAGFGITALANIYDEIKRAVADVVVDVIGVVPGLSNLCGEYPEECKKAVILGMETGLHAMGMPPSLPNWDELKAKGVAYLASEISEQEIPADIAEQFAAKALDIAQNSIEQMTAKRGGQSPQYRWVVPYSGLEPATLVTRVLSEDGAVLPSNLLLSREESFLYARESLHVPTNFKESAVPHTRYLDIPMVLSPNLDSILAPECRIDKFGVASCEPKYPPSSPPVCIWTRLCKEQGCQGTVTETDNCSGPITATRGQALVARYYRDMWLQLKYAPSYCETNEVRAFTEDAIKDYTTGASDTDWFYVWTPFPANQQHYDNAAFVQAKQLSVWFGADPFDGCSQ